MDEALIKRVLPHSIEAEQAVVGAMLMDKEAILTSSEIISGADFYQSAYGVVFEAIVEIYNEGKPVDLVTLQSRLKEKDVPAEISSLEFVRDLVAAGETQTQKNSLDYVKVQTIHFMITFSLSLYPTSRYHPRTLESFCQM